MVTAVVALMAAIPASAQAQGGGYADLVTSTPGLTAYWRLAGGAPGALIGDPDTSTRFDGVDDEFQGSSGPAVGTLEGWFVWEAGVAVMRDSTASGGWILAFDSGGRVAYRVAGTTLVTSVATADLRAGWHHVVLTVADGATAFYLDGERVHTGAAPNATAPTMPWHVMRNGTTSQYTRGRADEVAVYDTALPQATIREHFQAAARPSTTDLLRAYSPHLRYEAQETYFADSAAEMTDNFVSGSRQNVLVGGSGARIAAANPADPLPNLSLAFLGDPTYANGSAATTSDYLDAANGFYQQDAQRMRAAGYRDRVYGRAVTAGGKAWLQYWLFSYYNAQNVLGFGVHEGDWEFIQVGLDTDGVPDVATYAQHAGGERCAWSQVGKAGAAPVVYVALASHASYFSTGVNPRGFYPDDYHRGGGYQVRPALEIVTSGTPFMAWRGKWGASSSSPVAPRRQGKWGDPNGFNANAAACTVGTAQASATARALRADVAPPRITARRAGERATVRYRSSAPAVLISIAQSGAPDVAVGRRARGPRGVATLRLPPGSGPYAVSASAFDNRGGRSPIVTTPLR